MGARHAGHDIGVARQMAAIVEARRVCARCHRFDERFIGNRLCRSCDARDRELIRGRNSKGAFPRFIAERWHLHPVALRLVQASVVAKFWDVVDRASDVLDAIITLVRRKQAMMFSRMPVAQYWPAQMSFWGGGF